MANRRPVDVSAVIVAYHCREDVGGTGTGETLLDRLTDTGRRNVSHLLKEDEEFGLEGSRPTREHEAVDGNALLEIVEVRDVKAILSEPRLELIGSGQRNLKIGVLAQVAGLRDNDEVVATVVEEVQEDVALPEDRAVLMVDVIPIASDVLVRHHHPLISSPLSTGKNRNESLGPRAGLCILRCRPRRLWIPLRQVRRALETYAGIGRCPPRADYRPTAARLIRGIARPDAPRQVIDDLVEGIVESAGSGQLDTEALAPLLQEVVGPRAPDEQLDGPRLLAIYAARFAARARFHELEDWHFRWARAFHWWASQRYATEWRALASDRRFGSLHEPPSLESALNDICGNLLQILGMVLTGHDAVLPEFLWVDAWQTGRARLTVETGKAARLGLAGPSPDGILLGARITLDGDAA